MKQVFNDFKKYFRYALRSAKAELKSEVSGSYLNWLWWIIEPISMMLIYTFIFGKVFTSHEKYFPIFIFIGLSAWEFFNRMMVGSVKLIVNNRDLVTKVYIPKYILLFSKSLTYLFKMFISFGVVLVLMIFMKVDFHFTMLNFFILLPILYLISFGIGCFLMHFGVYVQDLVNLTNVGLRFVYMLSGVFYNINTRLHGRLGYVLLRVNPMAFLMSELRNVLLYNTLPDYKFILIYYLIGIVLVIFGIKLIKKNENSYAKVI